MKVIDLLNKISNGEEVPDRIVYHGNYYYNVGNENQAYYENCELNDNLFLHAVYNEGHLNDLVEIIEDKSKEDNKIKYIEYLDFKEYSDEDKMWCLSNKINEIIELLNNSMLLSEKEVVNGDTDE